MWARWWAVAVVVLWPKAEAAATPGIYPNWPAGFSNRGSIETSPSGTNFTLLGVGFCRGGPPGGATATIMVSYVRLSGASAPRAGQCFDICAGLARCTGVELRNSDDWCELQIPLLSRTGDGTSSSQTDWKTGADASAELALTGNFDSFNSVSGSPPALTTVRPETGFYCWGKQVQCDSVPAESCKAVNRYPCEESYKPNMCGPCVPLHVAQDGSSEREPGPASSPCVPDPNAVLPTLKVSLASPWYGGRGHEEALYLAMIYGVRKAWLDQQGTNLIPIPVSQRLAFPVNITGHTDTWGYTLSAEQLRDYGLPETYDTRIENHPMSGLRAMAALKQDDYTTQYGLMEPLDDGRTRPHCVIGSTPFGTLSGVLPHTTTDLPISHAATFYETPVLGWAFQGKEFADKTNHKYYLRVNRVGLDYHLALASLIQNYSYHRVGVVTSGTNRRLVRGLQESLGAGVELWVEDMSLENECGDANFERTCHMKLITSMERLREQDARIIIHEQGAVTQLENYWTSFADLLRNDTLMIQVGVVGDCTTPLLPPTNGQYGLDVLWENFRKASNMNNRGDWDQMPGNCRICPNWAFRDLPPSALTNRTKVAEYTSQRLETIYDWSSFCPEKPSMEDILNCEWCDQYADFWITPACADEMEAMRQQFKGSLCIGVARRDNDTMIGQWTDYLAGLTAGDLISAGAPANFFEVFNTSHPLYQATNVSLSDLWAGPWRRLIREKKALIDSLLLSLVAFNTWVRAAGESMAELSATQLRAGFRTTQNSAITNWLSTIRSSTFSGLTGDVQFNDAQERQVDYTIYSAQGLNLSFSPVASFVVGGALTFTDTPIFNDGTAQHPPDRQPACAAGTQYSRSARGCSACPPGSYCPGDPSPMTRVPAIACGAGKVAPSTGAVECRLCPIGTMPNEPRTACITCREGRHASEMGSPGCARCAAGRSWALVPATNASLELMDPLNTSVSDCVACPKGRYQDQMGETSCKDCGLGQQTQTIGSVSMRDCLCPEEYYLPSDTQEGCKPCPDGMVCAIGSDMGNYYGTVAGGTGNYPRLRPRYWSTPEDPLSVYQCLDENVCPGLDPGKCALGTTDLVCANCPEKSYRAGDTCLQCNAVEVSKVLFPVAPCLFICPAIALFYMVSRTPVQRWSTPKTGLICCGAVMLIHFQIQGLLWTFNLYFPPSLGQTWGRFNELVTGLAVFRPRCAGVTAFKDTYYMNVALPLVVLFCFSLTFGMSRFANFAFNKCAFAMQAGNSTGLISYVVAPLVHVMDFDYMFSSFGAVMETFFVAIAKISVSLFHCYQHPNGKSSLFIAPDILCDSSQRQELIVVGLAAIFLYCICGSAVIVYALLRAPHRFETEAFQKRWRFLLSKYRPDVHWWSAVLLVRSLLLSLAAIIFSDGSHQLLYVIVVMMVYGFAVNFLKPWRHTLTNIFDATMSVMLIAAASAMFRFSANPVDTEAQRKVDDMVTRYTQATNFLPQAVAVLFGVHLVYLHFHPQIQARADEKLANDLERAAMTLAKSVGSGGQLKKGITILSELDKQALSQALHILLTESQIRLFNLRKSLGLKEIEREPKDIGPAKLEEHFAKAISPEPSNKVSSVHIPIKAAADGFLMPLAEDSVSDGHESGSPNFVRVLRRDDNGRSLTPKSVPSRMEG